MNNNLQAMLQRMLSQGGANPQAMAQRILQQNPQFAKMLQGQNPQDLLNKQLQQMGINPNEIQRMIPKK